MEDIVRKLRNVADKHRNDFVPTFSINITEMATDCADYIESLETDLSTYRALGTIDTLKRLQRDYSDLRNELCLTCGKYKESHLGRCNGCRWNKEEHHEAD